MANLFAAKIHAAKHGIAETMSKAVPATGALAKGGRTRLPIPAALKHEIMRRDQGTCTHTDPSGRRCQSSVGVQIEHIHPVSRGGGNDVKNLRLLCREHNIMAAQLLLGEAAMAPWLTGDS